jgi:hypothetical protein
MLPSLQVWLSTFVACKRPEKHCFFRLVAMWVVGVQQLRAMNRSDLQDVGVACKRPDKH